MRRLTFGGKSRFPIWSADGQRIAFQSDREGDLGIFWQRTDGTGTAERLTKPEQGTSHVSESWSPDGKRFLFAATKDSNVSLWAYSFEDKKAMPLGDVRSRNPISSVFSPDGRWVAYYSNEMGGDAIYVQPFPTTGAKYQIPTSDPGEQRPPPGLVTRRQGATLYPYRWYTRCDQRDDAARFLIRQSCTSAEKVYGRMAAPGCCAELRPHSRREDPRASWIASEQDSVRKSRPVQNFASSSTGSKS